VLEPLQSFNTLVGNIFSAIVDLPGPASQPGVLAPMPQAAIFLTLLAILHVHPPEDILLQKLRWYGRGGETSERQWRDILGIIRVQAQRLDREYLRVNAPVLGVADLLARALREATDEG
jgi:hypothetical protein